MPLNKIAISAAYSGLKLKTKSFTNKFFVAEGWYVSVNS